MWIFMKGNGYHDKNSKVLEKTYNREVFREVIYKKSTNTEQFTR